MMTTMTIGAAVAVTAAGTAIPEVIRKLRAAAGMSVRARPALATAMKTTTGGARAMLPAMTTSTMTAGGAERGGLPARGPAHVMMTTMAIGAAVAVTAAGTAIPEVIRKLRAAAGMSVRARPALATVMRTTTGGARAPARVTTTMMMIGGGGG